MADTGRHAPPPKPGSHQQHHHDGRAHSSWQHTGNTRLGDAGANGNVPAGRTGGEEPLIEADEESAPSLEGTVLVAEAAAGLRARRAPVLVPDGMGGTYVVHGTAGAPVGVLKPADEEPLGPRNPRGNTGAEMGAAGVKPSVRVGEAAFREVGGVPPHRP